MKKIVPIILVTTSIILLSGCATVLNGRYQNVAVQTQPTAADCMLTNDKGHWSVSSTPGLIKVHRSNDALHVTCRKEGYTTTTQIIDSHIKAAMLGNILAGGLIGVGVDDVDGAGFGYPHEINLSLPLSNKH